MVWPQQVDGVDDRRVVCLLADQVFYPWSIVIWWSTSFLVCLYECWYCAPRHSAHCINSNGVDVSTWFYIKHFPNQPSSYIFKLGACMRARSRPHSTLFTRALEVCVFFGFLTFNKMPNGMGVAIRSQFVWIVDSQNVNVVIQSLNVYISRYTSWCRAFCSCIRWQFYSYFRFFFFFIWR